MNDHRDPNAPQAFGHSLSEALNLAGFPQQPTDPTADASPPPSPARNRGRVDIRREVAGRGGKTVTVVSGFVGIALREKEDLARRMRKACGTGGTVKEGRIEIQGDRRELVARLLREAGFCPVFAGG